MKQIAILGFAMFLAGCVTDQPTPQADVVTRVGFLAEQVMQHPIVAGGLEKKQDQFYFDIGDKPGSMNQIIVVYPVGMKIPTEIGRKVELTGTIESISFKGGKVGNSGYSNDILTLQSWRYLD